MRLLPIISLVLAAAGPVSAQQAPSSESRSEARPIRAEDDPLNRFVLQGTTDGLIVQLRIEGTAIALQRAQPARIPRRPPARRPAAENVVLTAYADGVIVGSATVTDPALNVEEGRGVFRVERRFVNAALPTERAPDTLEVRLAAAAAGQRFDLRPVYEPLCRALASSPLCARSRYRR